MSRPEESPFQVSGSVVPPDLLRVATEMQRQREDRPRFFPPDLFAEPAWDILLALYIARGRGYRLKVSDACFEARVPATTALRWLDQLERLTMVQRRKNRFDGRSHLVDLSDDAVEAMNSYLAATARFLSRI